MRLVFVDQLAGAQQPVFQKGLIRGIVVILDNVDGFVEIPVPLYSKRLITAFRPLLNGEAAHYVSAIIRTDFDAPSRA